MSDRQSRSIILLSRQAPKLTRRLQTQLLQMLEILSLEHVHDTNRPEAGYFALIDPADPAIEEICLLTNRLQCALQMAGVSLPSDCFAYA